MALRIKAEQYRQEQLKRLGIEDTLDPKFIPPPDAGTPIKVPIIPLQPTTAIKYAEEREAETAQRRADEERHRQEAEKRKQEATQPRPFDRKIEPHHRDGSIVHDQNFNIGVLKDVNRYGATFVPLDLQGYQREKALAYVSLRDTYQQLYIYEAENHEENAALRLRLNTSYDEFILRYGNLNAKQNVKMIMMDAGGRDVLSLEREESGQFVKATSSTIPCRLPLKQLAGLTLPKKPFPPRSTNSDMLTSAICGN